MKSQTRLKVGIIGLGAIGGHVANCIEKGEAGNAELVALVCRDKTKYLKINEGQSDAFKALISDDIETLFAAQPDIVIEAAGQSSLNQYGIAILERGVDLLVSSIGLFTDDETLKKFTLTAEQSGAKMLLSAGALPALDWMSASSLSAVEKVSITQEKPVISWKGTYAEALTDLDVLIEPTCFFEGTAREAANLFPKSSNISAMLALATVGLDSTEVRLVADPINPNMNTVIEFESEVGNMQLSCQGIPSQSNPSTSTGVPLSIVKSIRNLSSPIHYGV
ncbi:aspartate dehydrogenase [Marinomonas sp.]|nr:aspartate dehydrogenase [Marinomonas sp.]MDB4837909.1 aspartate dehydrogenase [Marinomonas sp.]